MSKFDFGQVQQPAPPPPTPPVSFWDIIALGLIALVGAAVDLSNGADQLARGADVLARKYRWGISTSWPPALLMAIGSLPPDRPRSAVDSCILEYYQRNNWLELGALIETLCAHGSVSVARRRVLRDLAAMMRAGNGSFNPASFALPTLFPELEGICRDFVTTEFAQKYASLKTRPSIVKYAVKHLKKSAYPIERHGLHLVANVVYKNHGEDEPRRGKRLSRHIQLHRGSEGPRHLTDVVRVLLLIDLVAYLIDVHRGGVSDVLTLRRAWGSYLSDAAARGQESIKLGVRASVLLQQTQGKPAPPMPAAVMPPAAAPFPELLDIQTFSLGPVNDG